MNLKFITLFFFSIGLVSAQEISYPIVDTGQTQFYTKSEKMGVPSSRSPLARQDAGEIYNAPKYKDNGDGTASDLITGLMWEKDMGEKITFPEAKEKAKKLRTGGYDDWRIPSIKELYSLIQFTGQSMGERVIHPYIDTLLFKQPIGNLAQGEREIDAQTWSSTIYSGMTMGRQTTTIFGVNFVDGRIKGYPLQKRRDENKMYFRMVRGNPDYGKNKLIDNGDGTVSDFATGLMWQKTDNGKLYDWEQALAYASNLKLAGYSDWRIPNAKELQSIVDYTRSPEKTNSPAISPLFQMTSISVNGMRDYPYFWTSTTHLDGPNPYSRAVYICFGRAWGKNPRTGEICDVHGAGAQRSDPKSGNANEYPKYFGPQGDRMCVFNAVRCVRRFVIPENPDKQAKNTVPFVSLSARKDIWRFAVIGDTHVPQSNILEKIIPMLLAEKVEVVVFVGDLIQGGKGQNGRGMQKQLETWMNMVQPLRDAGIKIIAIRGNHEADVKGNSIEVWKQFFDSEMNVCKCYKNVTFIGLDNYVEGERTVDLAWFKKTVSRAEGTLIVPFGHEPAFTTGTFHPQCLDEHLDIRNAFWSILMNAGVKYYFCGHAHQYNLAKIEKDGKVLFQIVSGGGGGQLQKERNVNQDADYDVQSKTVLSENGYLLVEVNSKGLIPVWRRL